MKRYEKQVALYEIGISGQQKLSDAKVLIIGIGGLGCPVLQNLTAAGVGTIGIIDGDFIEETNLHRQLLFNFNDIGKTKVAIAKEVVSKQNSLVKINSYPVFFGKNNALEIVSDYQIIVDCTDSISTRYLINDVCLLKNIPMVYASIHKFEGQLSVFNYKNGPTYRCLFPENHSLKHFSNCDDSGVLGVLPNTLGILQSTEVLKIILEIGTVLNRKLLLYNGLNFAFQTIDFHVSKEQKEIGIQKGNQLLNIQTFDEIKVYSASKFIDEVLIENNLVIDIRETYEEPKLNFSNIKLVPLVQLEDYLKNVSKEQKIILCCQNGNTSKMSASYLINNGFKNVCHLENGVSSLFKSNFFIL